MTGFDISDKEATECGGVEGGEVEGRATTDCGGVERGVATDEIAGFGFFAWWFRTCS